MTRVLFTNGALFDGRRHLGRGSVVVEDGRILAVVPDDAGALRELGPGAETVDLAGGLLSPGFVDAHVHPVQGGLERLRCDLSGLDTRAEYLATIEEYAAAHPDAEWILGGGWAMPAFPGGTPTAADLDAVTGGRPAYLPNRDHHGAWVNTRALELAGVDEHTPDPPDGRIERDADGRPSGTLHEGATALVSRHVPRPTGADLHAAL
ncbi:amidohydrolase family protein, partial [Nocardioides sp.]|uniref:amidohydrolase family protein n=1 Tax=Nocardioides sp. TaxID=35761 RepID=UPI002ED89D98